MKESLERALFMLGSSPANVRAWFWIAVVAAFLLGAAAGNLA